MHVVVDTNVLVSLLFWRGEMGRLADLVNDRSVTLCFSPDTIDEFLRVVSYPHIRTKAKQAGVDALNVAHMLIAHSYIVRPRTRTAVITRDPSDNMFLDCAVAAGAACVISGDDHLRALEEYAGIPILSPRQFLNAYGV